jgi:ATP-dependent Clp protease ATP-binding subunit ClpC
VDFRNTLVIMTSNVGNTAVSLQSGPLGFRPRGGEADAKHEELRTRTLDALKRAFRPEFLNRIDEIIVFKRLDREQLRTVVEKMLRELRDRLAERRVTLELTDAAKDWLLERGYDEAYGARPLRRLIQREVENTLARRSLAREFGDGDHVRVDVEGEGEMVTLAVNVVRAMPQPQPVEHPMAA